MHRQNALSMRFLARVPREFFRTAIVGLDLAPMKSPRYDPNWPADEQALPGR